jgi:hypothetical protein
MLNGHLPFKGSKEDVVANKIVFDPLVFDEEEWEMRSKMVRNLIISCLEKKAENRIIIIFIFIVYCKLKFMERVSIYLLYY